MGHDGHGHMTGDQVLLMMAGLLRNALPAPPHTVARWGGDEFAVIYYGEKDQLHQLLENIRMEFVSHSAPFDPSLNFSFGIASINESDCINQLIAEADKKLYERKRMRENT